MPSGEGRLMAVPGQVREFQAVVWRFPETHSHRVCRQWSKPPAGCEEVGLLTKGDRRQGFHVPNTMNTETKGSTQILALPGASYVAAGE